MLNRLVAEGFYGLGEGGGEVVLLRRRQLFALRGEVEDVDGYFAFGVDERHFDVALAFGESAGQFAQEAGGILCDGLQQGAVGGGFVVEGEAGFDVHLCVIAAVGVNASAEECLQGYFL